MTINGQQVNRYGGPVIISVCCSCNAFIGIKPAMALKGSISHGYCRPCLDTELKRFALRTKIKGV